MEELVEQNKIGQGAFGRVYICTYRNRPIALKRFYSDDLSSWQNEVGILKILIFRPETIINFLGSAEKKIEDEEPEYWIFTEYYQLGSLEKYLRTNTVDPMQLVIMTKSIAHGLYYLHTSMKVGNEVKVKPRIAHRDLKPANILLKPGLTCVLADFGLAIREHDPKNHEIMKNGIGTANWVPPEICEWFCENKSQPLAFDVVLKGEIYTFSLIIWQIMMRTDFFKTPNYIKPYRVPYQAEVSIPVMSDYKKKIFDQGKRPKTNKNWSKHPIAKKMEQIMVKCWSCPDERPSSNDLHQELSSLIP